MQWRHALFNYFDTLQVNGKLKELTQNITRKKIHKRTRKAHEQANDAILLCLFPKKLGKRKIVLWIGVN
jgi:hypothetical protein